MKKRIVVILCFVQVLVASISIANIAYGDTDPPTYNKIVKGKVIDETDKKKIYSVDVTWGAMDFTYTRTITPIWNEQTHDYDEQTNEKWSAEGNYIQFTNHSNTAVTASMSYKKGKGYNGVNGTFSKGRLVLPSALGKSMNASELTSTSDLTLSGILDDDVSTTREIGKIKVIIN